MSGDVRALVQALDTDDVRAQRRAGEQLRAAGSAAVPLLVDALSSSSSRLRKAAAFLLGTAAAPPEAIAALGRAAIEDPEPKVRKNAVISLGLSGSTGAVAPLAAALQREALPWIRPSIMLALGAIGGPAAYEVLRGIDARDQAERDALRKAMDRSAPARQRIAWRNGLGADALSDLRLLLDVPPGLETVALEEAAARGIGGLEHAGPGLLRCALGSAPVDLLAGLRCSYGLLIDAGEGPRLRLESGDVGPAIAHLIAESTVLARLHGLFEAQDGVIRYRFSLEGGRVRREALRTILDHVRRVCEPLGLVDSPSSYDVELRVSTGPRKSQLALRPSFMPDTRFAYRVKDVGASINPVVGACLARLARQEGSRMVFDPTCGSGTLLVERALLDKEVQATGLDISPTAVAAAHANVQAAGLERRVKVGRGDVANAEAWPSCDEVIANLPFGVRTQREELDLDRLYGALLGNVAASLNPGGRAVLFTSKRDILERSLERQRRALRLVEKRRVFSGGLWVDVWVLARDRA